jgi:hypothetical protein
MKHLLLIIPFLALIACNKEPGEGGTSSISGKVYKYEVDVFGNVLNEYYDADKDVYIIYGEDNSTYNDDFSTSFDGSFTFTNLTLGKYTVFTYTRCDACPSGDTITSITVDVTEKGTDYLLDDLIVYK